MLQQLKKPVIALLLIITALPRVVSAAPALVQPLTLPAALQYALSHSPDIAVQKARIDGAKAQLLQAGAAYAPQLLFQSGYTRTDNPMQAFGSVLNAHAFSNDIDFNDVGTADNAFARAVVSLSLFSAGKNGAGYEAAEAGQAAVEAAEQAARLDLALEVSRTFFTVLKAREYVKAADSALRSLEANLDSAGKLFNQGKVLRSEVLDIEVRRAQAREEQIKAENALLISLQALKTVIGYEEQAPLEVAAGAPPIEPPAAALERPEMTALASAKRAARAQVREAKAAWFPQVAAIAGAQYDRGFEYEGDDGNYTVGVNLNWNVWDGRLTAGRVQEATARLNSLEEQERKVRLAIDLERRQSELNLKAARERVSAAQAALAAAGESAALTRARFGQGLMLTTQLLDAENALTSARVRLAEAQADERIAVASLRRAMGWPVLAAESRSTENENHDA